MVTRLLLLVAVVSLAVCSRPPTEEASARVETAPKAWEGRYRLVTANGDSLPALLDHRPGCSVQLVYGALTLQDDRFYLTDTTRERCEAEASRQESRIAQGTYEVAGETLRFRPDSGAAFGAAEGVLGDGRIHLRGPPPETGAGETDWLFVRRDRPGR